MRESIVEIGETLVKSVILHQVGNRLREESLVLAEECFDITTSISSVILAGYLRGIVSSKNQFVLSHESNIALNDVAYHTSDFFLGKSSFLELSKNIAHHLYASAHHPNIASGDLFVILFDHIKIDGEYKSAIGIYKSESKQQYISAKIDGEVQRLEVSSGINPDLIDKGALIIDGSEVIYAIDRLSSRTKYWIDDFLKAKQIPNETTKSTVAAALIEKVRKEIESPATQQKFYHEIVQLCSNKDKVSEGDLKSISKKYAHDDVWSAELERVIEHKGLVDSSDFSIPSKKLQNKIKKELTRINLGRDITLIIPPNLLFDDVEFQTNGKKIIINLVLESENG